MRFRCDTDGVLTDRDDERHGAGPDGERTVVPGNEASCWTAVSNRRPWGFQSIHARLPRRRQLVHNSI